MSDKNKILALIEAYLEGELSPQEKLNFEQRLNTDQELADAWKLNQEVDLALKDSKAFEMEDLLKNMGNEFAEKFENQQELKTEPDSKPKKGIKPWIIIAILALLSILVFFLWSNLNPKETANPELLFAEVYEPYPVSNTIRSADDTTKTILDIAQLDYKDGKYDNSIQSLTTYLQEVNLTSNDIIIPTFYRGLAYMGNKEYDKASQDFNRVLLDKNHSYTQQTQWYLALIALKGNDIPSTKQWLNDVIQTADTGKYAKQARELLERLN